MIERFQGTEGQKLLRQIVLDQQCIQHNGRIADAILLQSQLVAVAAGQAIIEQGGTDNDTYLIVTGRFSIQVNGREVAIRKARQHVGEMATIDPTAKRSARVIALEESVVCKIAGASFAAVADAQPKLWRQLAVELGDRLRERTKYVSLPNPRPVIFVGCSVEGLTAANEIQAGLSHDDYVVQIWTNNLFIPGHGTMEDLENRIRTTDFGVLVCTPDDKVEVRAAEAYAPRDNVILELGMCLGALGRYRTMIVRPRTRDLKIPTDLLGITGIDYRDDDPANLAAHINPVCTAIRKVVNNLGPK